DEPPRKPITGICCARAASGHAAPPTSAMNSRRLRRGVPGIAPLAARHEPRAARADSSSVSLAQRAGAVFGADLNCSESVEARVAGAGEAASRARARALWEMT